VLLISDRADKNTTHSSLPLCEQLSNSTKETAKKKLEIGIQYGGSTKILV
jgi:hypothetical protein